MSFSFDGKRVLVTGGAQGFGKAIVKKFYECGATVFVADIKQEPLITLKKEFPNVITICVDLSKWDEAKEVIQKCGVLDHLVNNAGVVFTELVLNVTEEQLDRTFDVNFKAAFNLSQQFAKNVIANSTKGATIVNISSVNCQIGVPWSSVYGCSKAALSMMTKCFAVELGEYDIRVNAIAPTGMPTTMVANLSEELVISAGKIFDRQAIKGLLDTSDGANLVAYLSSPLSKMITGTIVPIDGGLLAA